MSQYHHIEKEANVTKSGKRGKSLLHHRNKITDARNRANKLVSHTFDVEHDPTSNWGDLVCVSNENEFRFMLDMFGLREKAESEGIEWALTGDGAQLTNKNKASQTLVGLKATDDDAKDPSDNNVYMKRMIMATQENVLLGINPLMPALSLVQWHRESLRMSSGHALEISGIFASMLWNMAFLQLHLILQ